MILLSRKPRPALPIAIAACSAGFLAVAGWTIASHQPLWATAPWVLFPAFWLSVQLPRAIGTHRRRVEQWQWKVDFLREMKSNDWRRPTVLRDAFVQIDVPRDEP